MTSAQVSITLNEWQTRGPTDCNELTGRCLDASYGTRIATELLSKSNLLELTELRHGLQVQAFSHVGKVRIGDLTISVLPKIKGTSLLSLVRYAYGFRRLNLISDSTHSVDDFGFEDLLISQLNAEVQELISRGLLRSYIGTNERMSSPRGRIDLHRLALDGGVITASLPCNHHPRIEDTLLNRVLRAGLELAASLASVVELRRESRRLASLMKEQVATVGLNGKTMDLAMGQMNRLATAYSSAISIIRLLVEAQGIVLEGQAVTTTLPGFLFDMNVFFQALVSRLLRENLPGYSVRDEHGLKGMMKYNQKFNPQRRQSPTPRPDYVVMHKGKLCSILDAKYRDLWEKQLPREMLYQLVVYAVSNPKQPQSSILYPTTNDNAKEARIDICDPMFGSQIGQVCLRPIHMPTVVELVSSSSLKSRSDREAFARQLAFGVS